MTELKTYHFMLLTALLAAFALQSGGNFFYFVADVQTAFTGTFLIEVVLTALFRRS